MNAYLFVNKFKKEYPELFTTTHMYYSVDSSWMTIFETKHKVANSKELNIVLKLIINKFDFTTKNEINLKKNIFLKIGENLTEKINISPFLEKEYYHNLISHPTYTGRIMKWNSKGILLFAGDYFNGKKNGIWTKWYTNGEKKIQGKFIDGNKFGEFIQYSKIGTIYRKINFINNIPDGYCTVFHPNGKIKKLGKYKAGKKKGIWKHYDNMGNKVKLTVHS